MLLHTRLLAALLWPAALAAAPLDINALWDFGRPAVSEQRFREAMAGASDEDRLVLLTQVARTQGLRRDVDGARSTLAQVAASPGVAAPRVQAHYQLELGRTYASATQAPEAGRAPARTAFLKAHEVAAAARLDALAVDALHMMAFVDTAPEDRLRWSRQALDAALASDQPAARRWEGSLRNNIGLALQDLGRHAEALAEFRQMLAAREKAGSVVGARIAQWMVAHSLRLQGQLREALAMQLALEKAWEAAGETDKYVFEELEQLYRALGEPERAAVYAARLKAAPK